MVDAFEARMKAAAEAAAEAVQAAEAKARAEAAARVTAEAEAASLREQLRRQQAAGSKRSAPVEVKLEGEEGEGGEDEGDSEPAAKRRDRYGGYRLRQRA